MDRDEQAEELRRHQLLKQDQTIKAIRWACFRAGYTLTVHGTRQRDLDLVAIPWQDDAETCNRLMLRIVDAGFIHSPPEKKPHGRVAYVLHHLGKEMGCQYIDLSVMPRLQKRHR